MNRRRSRKTSRRARGRGGKTARRKTSTRGAVLRRIGRWLAWSAVAVVCVSVALTLPLRWLNPPATAFMLADDSGRVPVLQDWLDWSEMGSAAPLAVIAAEDQRFAGHFGFDIESIADSIKAAESGARLRGASTISQQLTKNLYLWNGRSFLRKALEAWLTVFLEAALPKRRILEIYLNVIELGPGIYGVGAASRYFFGKPVARLTDREAALLAAVLPNPHRLRADRPSEYLRGRQDWIVSQMARLRREGWLTRL